MTSKSYYQGDQNVHLVFFLQTISGYFPSILTNEMPLTFPNGTQIILTTFFFQKLAQNLVSQWGETKNIIGTA